MRIPLTIATIASLTILAQPRTADAFCGFYVAGAGAKLYNDATQVVLMRQGTRTVLSMQNNYKGPATDFAMVVPVPTVLQKSNVKVLPPRIFERVDQLSSPRLVEYWEQDPCAIPKMPKLAMKRPMVSGRSMAKRSRKKADKDYQVTVEARFEVGEYEILILSAEEAVGLENWLVDNKYKIPKGAAKVLRPYIASGMKFFVAKVDIEKVKYDKSGRTKLSPLRFHYDSDVFSLPVRLGLLNSSGQQDLLVYILARNQRYELANYQNVTIPTNLRVRKRTRFHFARFYNSLFDDVMRKNPRSVVTEYSWQAMKCDPCPGPNAALQPWELATLGADVLGGGSMARSRPGRRGRRVRFRGGGFVLTRLHTRYSKRTLGEDLIFKAASPIVGGREFIRGKRVEQGSHESSINNFQARYIIRHRWTGKITCENPRRGRWGGPPRWIAAKNQNASSRPAVATDLGLRKRRKVPVANYVLQHVPEIGLRWKYKGKRKRKK